MLFFDHSVGDWHDRLAFGRYKHVSCFGYVPGSDVWMFVEPAYEGTRLEVVPDGPGAQAVIERLFGIADGMMVEASKDKPPIWYCALGWCVPHVARVIGRGFGALRPDALWSALEPYALETFHREAAENQAGSGAGGPAAARQAG